MKRENNSGKKANFDQGNYKIYKEKLLSSSTSILELEKICMTLAHDPGKKAQDLLAGFKESAHAHKVKWLNCAIEEGQFVYLEPKTPQEEKEYLKLKVIQKIQDKIINLNIDLNKAKLNVNMLKIEHKAIKELVKNGEINSNEGAGLEDIQLVFETKVKELMDEIELKEKMTDYLIGSIKTERYKDLDPLYMKDIHFC